MLSLTELVNRCMGLLCNSSTAIRLGMGVYLQSRKYLTQQPLASCKQRPCLVCLFAVFLSIYRHRPVLYQLAVIPPHSIKRNNTTYAALTKVNSPVKE